MVDDSFFPYISLKCRKNSLNIVVIKETIIVEKMAHNKNSINTTTTATTTATTTTPLLGSINNAELEKGENNERPNEPWKGEIFNSIVGAGLDAIVNSFALMSSISARHLSSEDVLVLGFANLIADGISKGFGDFVSSRTEKAVSDKERKVTEWEVTNHRSPQREMLQQQYEALGIDANDASTVVKIFGKYKDILVHENMAAEKGTLPPDDSNKPWKNGLITFTAFILFGSAPLLAFLILKPFTHNETHKFIAACVFSSVALAILGIAKAKICGQNYAVSLAVTVFNGAIAGAAAYLIGWALRNAGLED